MKNNLNKNKNAFGYTFVRRWSAILLSVAMLGTQVAQTGSVFASEPDVSYGVQLINNTGWNLEGASLVSGEEGYAISIDDSENGGSASQLVDLTGIASAIDAGGLKAVFSATVVSNGAIAAKIEFAKQDGGTESQDIYVSDSMLAGIVTVPAGARSVTVVLSGQVGESFSAISLTIPDSAAPTLSAQYTQGWAGQDVNVTLTAQDGGDPSGSASSVKGIYRENGDQVSDTGSYSYTATQTETAVFYALDHAGNKSELLTVSVQIDRGAPAEPPVITLSTTDVWAKEGTLTLAEITPTEGESPETRQYRFNQNEWQYYAVPITLPEGEYTVQARTIDAAGNASEASAAQTAKVDFTAPQITATAAAHAEGGATITTQVQDPAPAGGNAVGSAVSGIGVVKWAAGTQTAEYFAEGGTAFAGNTFTVTAGGVYTVFAQDNAGNVAVQTVEVNMYPSLQLITNQIMDEDATKSISFTVSDPEGEQLTITAASSNTAIMPNPVVELADGTASLLLAPIADKYGAVEITVSVSDGKNIQTASFDVVILPVNDAPVAVDDTAITNEDTAVTIDVLANDTDIDGDTLTIKSGGISGVTGGTAVIESGKIKFTPAANFNGEAKLTYIVTDGKAEATAEVVITVTPVNDVPVVSQTINATTQEDIALTGLIAYDVDGDTLNFEITTAPAHGEIDFDEVSFANNVRRYNYIYIPGANYNGSDSFTVKVKDATTEATSTVNITVTPVNDPPEFIDLAGSYYILEDAGAQSISFKINDVETVNSALMMQVANLNDKLISSASISVNGLGDDDPAVTLNYTPIANANGIAQIRLILSDGFLVVSRTITINIEPVNDAPVAVDDTLNYTEDQDLLIDMDDLIKNDTDVEGDALAFAGIDTYPAESFGKLEEVNVQNHIWKFTPNPNVDFSGTFKYVVTDGKATSVGTVTLKPIDVNDAPTLAIPDGLSYQLDEDGYVDIPFEISDLETAENSLIVIAGTSNPALIGADGLSITRIVGANKLRITPNQNQNGTATVTLTVSDGELAVTKTLTIVVRPVQDAPVVVDDRVATSQWGTIQIAALANDTDPDGDPLTIKSVGTVSDAVITHDGTTVTFKDTKGTTRIVIFSYTVSDGNGNDTIGHIRVSIGGKSVAPSISSVANQYIYQDEQTTALPFTVHDPEGAPLTVTATSGNTTLLPNNADNVRLVKLEDGNYTVQLVPVIGQHGTADVTLSVSDGDNTVTTVVKLTVYRVNKPPVANNATVDTVEDVGVEIDLLSYSHDEDDPGKEKTRVVEVTSPTKGRLSLVSDGIYKYTPKDNLNGTDTFTYTITDGEATSTGTITVVVAPVNDTPYFLNNIWRQLENQEGAQITIPIIVDGIVRDADNTLSELFVDSIQNVVGGKVVISDDLKSVTFTRDASGAAASFQVMIRDRESTADPDVEYSGWATVTIGTAGTNSLWLENLWYEKDEDAAAFTVDLENHIRTNYANATVSIDTSKLKAATATLTGGGAIETAVVTITPQPDAYTDPEVPEYITYTVTPDGGSPISAQIRLTLWPVNDAPKMDVDPASLLLQDTTFDEDETTGDYIINLSDIDNTTIDFNVYIQNQDPGSPVILSDGIRMKRVGNTATFSFKPVENASGEATITLQASDGIVSVKRSFTLIFTAVNDVPVAPNYSVTVQEDSQNNPIPVVFANTDADGDTLTVTVKEGEGPQNGTVSIAGGIISYTPKANYNGPDSFVYVLNDGNSGIAEGTVTIVVVNINDDPEITGLKELYTMEEDAPAFTLPFTVTDDDGEVLEVTFTHTNPELFADMQLLGSGKDRQISATPAANAFGKDTVTVTVKDAAAKADASLAVVYTFEIVVTPVNDLPIGRPDAYTIDEDEVKILNVLENDDDIEDGKDKLKIIAVSATVNGGKVENLGGQLKYTPKANFNGTDSFTYTISDTNNGHAENISVTITIKSVNDAPTANNDSATTDEDIPVTIDVLKNDTDVEGNTLTLVENGFSKNANGTGAVENGTATIQNGKVVFTPNANWNGTAVFYYTVSDGQAEYSTSRGRVTVVVNPINDDPEITNPDNGPNLWTMLEDELNVSKREFVFTVSDPETAASNLIVTIASKNNEVFPTTQITLTGSTGIKTVTLPQPKKDYYGDVIVTITVSDGILSVSRDYTVSVTPVNDPPVVSGSDSITTNEDTAASGSVSATDVDNDVITYSVGTNPAHGTVSINATTGVYEYTPNLNYNGDDSFVIAVSDGTATVNKPIAVTVVPVNDPPVPKDYSITILEDGEAVFDVLADATDVEGNTITIVSGGFSQNANGTGTVLNGTASIDTNGGISKVKFKPTLNWNGTTTFYYTISDGQAQNATARGKITIIATPVNDSPTFTGSANISTNEDTPFNGTITATDVDNDPLTYAIKTQPANGSLIFDPATRKYTYTPALNYNGTDSFVVTVSDGTAITERTINITVVPVNDPPKAENHTVTTPEDTPILIDVLANATDVEGNTITIVNNGFYKNANGTGTVENGTASIDTSTGKSQVKFDPAKDWNGTAVFYYKISDGQAQNSTAIYQITVIVTAVNDAPAVTNVVNITTDEDTAKTGTVDATDVDKDKL